MMRMQLLVATLTVLTACGGDTPAGPNDYTLSGRNPLPEALTMGQQVRTVLIVAETRTGADMRGNRCGFQFPVFDVIRASEQTPQATGMSGDCRLYMAPPETAYNNQRWVCAGGFNVESGSLTQNQGFCPMEATAAPWEGTYRNCGALFESRSATLASVDEIGPDDQVTDLMGTVRFSTPPTVTQPTGFTVTTWPASGDLVVAWTSADATSAVVRIEPDATTRMGPTILCTPRTNGTMRIDAALIDMGRFRAAPARLRVWSYRETTVQAMGRAWQLVGAMGTSVLLQPGR
jgi:hypothetical protein